MHVCDPLFKNRFSDKVQLALPRSPGFFCGKKPNPLFRPLPSRLISSLVLRCFFFGRAISVFSERSFQHSSFKRSRTFLQCFTDFLENIARSASPSSKSLEFREMLVKICEFLTKFVQSLLLLFFLFLFHAMCCKRNLKIVQCFFDIRQNCVEFCEIGTEDLKRG